MAFAGILKVFEEAEMVTASSNYKQIKRGERAYRPELHPDFMQMVLTVRDARGCTPRRTRTPGKDGLRRTAQTRLFRYGT